MTMGIRKSKAGNKFYASIAISGKFVHLGTFNSEMAAKSAYFAAKKKFHQPSCVICQNKFIRWTARTLTCSPACSRRLRCETVKRFLQTRVYYRLKEPKKCVCCEAIFIRKYPRQLVCSEVCRKRRLQEYQRRYKLKDPDKKCRQGREFYARNIEKVRAMHREWYWKNRDKHIQKTRVRRKKIVDLVAVLREINPEMLKEFGL